MYVFELALVLIFVYFIVIAEIFLLLYTDQFECNLGEGGVKN